MQHLLQNVLSTAQELVNRTETLAYCYADPIRSARESGACEYLRDKLQFSVKEWIEKHLATAGLDGIAQGAFKSALENLTKASASYLHFAEGTKWSRGIKRDIQQERHAQSLAVIDHVIALSRKLAPTPFWPSEGPTVQAFLDHLEKYLRLWIDPKLEQAAKFQALDQYRQKLLLVPRLKFLNLLWNPDGHGQSRTPLEILELARRRREQLVAELPDQPVDQWPLWVFAGYACGARPSEFAAWLENVREELVRPGCSEAFARLAVEHAQILATRVGVELAPPKPNLSLSGTEKTVGQWLRKITGKTKGKPATGSRTPRRRDSTS